MSLFATTVSLALTFGTAAIIDHNKKQSEKREIVMMVMYDMYNSLKSIEKGDSMIHQSMDIQRQIAEDTTKFDTLRFKIAMLMPKADYTETTERIFSSNIETINTVGNVLFTENVAKFYQSRQMYKTEVCDSLYNEITHTMPFTTLKGTLDCQYLTYALMSNEILKTMRYLYALCKQMVDVTDKQMEAYRKEREQIENGMTETDEATDSTMNKIMELQGKIDEAKSQLTIHN